MDPRILGTHSVSICKSDFSKDSRLLYFLIHHCLVFCSSLKKMYTLAFNLALRSGWAKRSFCLNSHKQKCLAHFTCFTKKSVGFYSDYGVHLAEFQLQQFCCKVRLTSEIWMATCVVGRDFWRRPRISYRNYPPDSCAAIFNSRWNHFM